MTGELVRTGQWTGSKAGSARRTDRLQGDFPRDIHRVWDLALAGLGLLCGCNSNQVEDSCDETGVGWVGRGMLLLRECALTPGQQGQL